MRNKVYSEMVSAFTTLSEADKQMFIDTIMNISNNEVHFGGESCDSIIRENAHKDYSPDCPYCGAKAELGYILKQGFYRNGSQRYSCKSCKKIFY